MKDTFKTKRNILKTKRNVMDTKAKASAVREKIRGRIRGRRILTCEGKSV